MPDRGIIPHRDTCRYGLEIGRHSTGLADSAPLASHVTRGAKQTSHARMGLLVAAGLAVVRRLHQLTMDDVHGTISKRAAHPVGVAARSLKGVREITAPKFLLMLHAVGVTWAANGHDVSDDLRSA